MARPKLREREEIKLHLSCERRDFHNSIIPSSPNPKLQSGPFIHSSEIRLECKVLEPRKFKWPTGVLNIRPNENMSKSTKRVEIFGLVETKKTVFRASVYWPAEEFSSLVSIVASGRDTEAQLYISPIKYRSGEVLGLTLDTRTSEEIDKELDFWNGPELSAEANG